MEARISPFENSSCAVRCRTAPPAYVRNGPVFVYLHRLPPYVAGRKQDQNSNTIPIRNIREAFIVDWNKSNPITMDSPKQAETSPLTGHETPHRTPIDAALDHDDPKGKLLFSFPLSNYFRPWTLAWGIIAASITMHAHTGDVLGHITVAFTWVFVAWTILATASHHVHSSYSPPRELRVNLGAFVCTCTGGQDEDDGEEPGRSKNRLSGQALVDLTWSAIFIVFASLSTIQYSWNSKEMVISSLFIIA